MHAPSMPFVEKSFILRRFWRVTGRSPVTDVGTPRARNLMKTVSKEGNRSNVCKRHAVSSEMSTFVYRVSEVTEGKVCGPENDEISSTNNVLRDGKEPPRKGKGMFNVCPTLRE